MLPGFEPRPASTVRGCFVPGDGKVFIDADYGQIELVVLGYALEKQFGLGLSLARVINADNDVHRLIAGAVLGKDPKDVTKVEAPVGEAGVRSAGPAAWASAGFRRVAKAAYGIELSDQELHRASRPTRPLPGAGRLPEGRGRSHRRHRRELGMTPAQYYDAVGTFYDPLDPKNTTPAGWLGGMLLKVLRGPDSPDERGQRACLHGRGDRLLLGPHSPAREAEAESANTALQPPVGSATLGSGARLGGPPARLHGHWAVAGRHHLSAAAGTPFFGRRPDGPSSACGRSGGPVTRLSASCTTNSWSSPRPTTR